MTNKEIITGKVAKIVSDREIILNKGSADGIESGMVFNILDPNSMDVTDPDTGESLGGIKNVKVSVVAVQMSEHMTLAETFRTTKVNVGGDGPDISRMLARSMMNPPRYIEKVETLKIDENSPRQLSEEDSIVRRGDIFESTSGSSGDFVRSVSVSP